MALAGYFKTAKMQNIALQNYLLPTMLALNTVLNVSKNGHFPNPPTHQPCPFADDILSTDNYQELHSHLIF